MTGAQSLLHTVPHLRRILQEAIAVNPKTRRERPGIAESARSVKALVDVLNQRRICIEQIE